jgi:hypothetical protein
MFGRYIKGQEVMSEIMRLFPDYDAMYPFEWNSSTLLQAAADTEAFERPVTSLKAKCVMPDGFVVLISAPDMDRTTFQILHHGTLALHLEVCFKHEPHRYYDDWRLGVMTFNYDAECNTLSMWSSDSGSPNHYYGLDDMFALYAGEELEALYERRGRNDDWDWHQFMGVFDTIWPVFKEGPRPEYAHLDLEMVQLQVDMIQAPIRRTAIAMGLHDKLGEKSWLYQLEPEIVHRITELAERESLRKHAMYLLKQNEYDVRPRFFFE